MCQTLTSFFSQSADTPCDSPDPKSLCGWEELYVESQKQTVHPAVDYLSDMGRTFVFRCTQLPS